MERMKAKRKGRKGGETCEWRWMKDGLRKKGGGIDRKGRSVKALGGVDVRWAGART